MLVAAGVFFSTLDSSMINVALPAISKAFQVGISTVDLVVLSYLMVISASLVIWGKIADAHGKGNVYLAGMVLFGAAAVGCGLAASFGQLILFRSLQAFGAAMMMAVGPALIKSAFPRDQLGRSLGLIGIATSSGLMCGPAVSGYLLSSLSWRAVFFVSPPICLVVAFLALRYLLPVLRSDARRSFAFDLRGTVVWVLLVTVAVLLIKTVTNTQAVILLGGVLALLLYLFVRIESAVRNPILPLALIRQRFFWTAASAAALSFCSLFIVIILLPFYLDGVLRYDTAAIGMTMMALPASLVVFSPLSGRLYDKIGKAGLISSAGLLLNVLALVLLMQLDQGSGRGYVSLCLCLLGTGQSIFLSPNSASVLNRVDERFGGVSAGILATSRNFGMMSGAAIAGSGFTLFASRLGEIPAHGPRLAEGASFVAAQNAVFAVALLLTGAAIILSLFRK